MVKVRLLRLHQHGKLLLQKGTILEVDERRGGWMRQHGIAEPAGVPFLFPEIETRTAHEETQPPEPETSAPEIETPAPEPETHTPISETPPLDEPLEGVASARLDTEADPLRAYDATGDDPN